MLPDLNYSKKINVLKLIEYSIYKLCDFFTMVWLMDLKVCFVQLDNLIYRHERWLINVSSISHI